VRTWAVETASIYQILDYTLDSGTLAYLVAISVAAAILFSLAPMGKVLQIGAKQRAEKATPGASRRVCAANTWRPFWLQARWRSPSCCYRAQASWFGVS